jgi:sugar transferase (PEP-CTERM/EpsH1 system associated)
MVEGMQKRRHQIAVVHLVSGLNVGGLEMVVLNLVRHCDRDRFKPHVICLQETGLLAPLFADLNVTVESLDCPTLPKAQTLYRLVRRLRKLRPHILHTHNINPHIFGAIGARISGVPVVVHTKHGRNYPDRPVAVFKNWFGSCFTDRIVAVSEDAARVVREIERVPGRKVMVIRNGIDLENFRFVPRNVKVKGKHAVHVARLCISKDQSTLLRAARQVLDVEPDFRLTLVGDGPDREALLALKESLGLGEAVSFLGERRNVHEYLSKADLFVLSSIEEGIPLTILEAMATGLPVIATEVGGNPEVVIPNDTGFLVPPRAPKLLADAILDLVRNPNRAQCMGSAGRKRVEQGFDIRKVVADYEALYMRTCNGANS